MKRIWLLLSVTTAIVFYSTSCKKEYSHEQAGKAAGSLKTTGGNCTPFTLHGTFQKGKTAEADSLYVIVEINVSHTGNYSIYTNTVNGFSFSAAGNFNSAGVQQVKLKSRGTPLNNTLTVFNCYFDSSVCSFSVPVRDSTTSGTNPADMAINTWQFFDSTNRTYHHGIIDTVNTIFEINQLWNSLGIRGWPGRAGSINQDTIFLVTLFLPRNVIDTGAYVMTSGIGGEHLFGYANNILIPGGGGNQYFCYYLSTPAIAPEFSFRIISYDSQQRLLKGSFSGISRQRASYTDFVGHLHSVSGSFYLRLQ